MDLGKRLVGKNEGRTKNNLRGIMGRDLSTEELTLAFELVNNKRLARDLQYYFRTSPPELEEVFNYGNENINRGRGATTQSWGDHLTAESLGRKIEGR